MSNQYNSKRFFSSGNEDFSSKKNKIPELIELSDDETNNSGEIGELQIKISHYRKNINKDWFSTYTWLESEEKNLNFFYYLLYYYSFFLRNKLIKLICLKFKLCANYNVTREFY